MEPRTASTREAEPRKRGSIRLHLPFTPLPSVQWRGGGAGEAGQGASAVGWELDISRAGRGGAEALTRRAGARRGNRGGVGRKRRRELDS
jgi:hypothetical protein